MRSYSERLGEALVERLGGEVTVSVNGETVAFQRGSATATTGFPWGVDRRGPVLGAQVNATLESASARLLRNIPHYKPEFVGPSHELVATLRAAIREVA